MYSFKIDTSVTNPWMNLFIMSNVIFQTMVTCNDPMRILVKYTDDSFVMDAMDLSMDGQLAENITDRKLLAITVEDSSVLQRLRESPKVRYATEDKILSRLVVGNFARDDTRTGLIGGNVDEEIVPYGISMVQADQLWDTPEIDTDLTICVVDTGVAVEHPVSSSSIIFSCLLYEYFLVIRKKFEKK